MSKSKRNSNRKPSRPTPMPTLNAIELEVSELENFLNALDRHYFANDWDQKSRLFEVDVNGKILSNFAIPLNVQYEQVIPLLPLNQNTFGLVFFSEGWKSTNPFVHPSVDPNRVEVRTGVWVDKLGRSFSGKKERGEKSLTINETQECFGVLFEVLHKAIGQHAEVPKSMKINIALKVLIDMNNARLVYEGHSVRFGFEALFANEGYEDILLSMFADFAQMYVDANDLNIESEQAKQYEFAHSMPLMTPLELEVELRALLPEDYELPKQFCSDEASLV